MNKKILIVKNISHEGPGILAELLEENLLHVGDELDGFAVELEDAEVFAHSDEDRIVFALLREHDDFERVALVVAESDFADRTLDDASAGDFDQNLHAQADTDNSTAKCSAPNSPQFKTPTLQSAANFCKTS